MRRRGRVDANHAEIVATLRAVGATVQSLAACGGGVPDLLVGYRGETFLFEVKDGTKKPSARRLTNEEVNWHTLWSGRRVMVVTSVRDALAAVGVGSP